MISMKDLQPNCNIFNEIITVQSLNSTFKRLQERSAVFGEKFPQKKETILRRFSSDNWNKLKGKQNHNSMFDYQARYKFSTLKIALTLFTNLTNKWKLISEVFIKK